MMKLILAGLLLPLCMYFQPECTAARIAALVPDLPFDYSLARRSWRKPDDSAA